MTRVEATVLLPYLFSLMVSLGVLAYTWKRRSVRGAPAFGLYMLGQSLWLASYILETTSLRLDNKIFWDKFGWLAGMLVLYMLPIFVAQYTDLRVRRPKRALLLSLLTPLGFASMVLTDELHHLVYPNPHLTQSSIFSELIYDFSLIDTLYLLYAVMVAGGCIVLLLRQSAQPHRLYRGQVAIIMLGFTIPLAGMTLLLFGIHIPFQGVVSPFALVVGNLLLAWGVYRFRFLEVVPLGRDKVFEAMVEPIVLLNNQHQVVDINSSMLDLLGKRADEVIGESAKEVFTDFPIPIKLYTHVSYARAETSFEVGGKTVHYEMTVWPLYDADRKMNGRIYISHDITALKELERELRLLNEDLEKRVEARTRELAEAYDTTLEGWARALELRDKETEGHSRRVVETTLRLARALEYPTKEMVHLRRGAILHDIGKMAVPDSILLKKDRLTEEERNIIKRHPEIAFQLLSQIPFLQKALDIPYCHHERWDGTGYPRGLKEREIPLAARIFALADVWDALSYNRPYNDAWPREKIIRHLIEEAGKQFDPRLVEIFLAMVERGEI